MQVLEPNQLNLLLLLVSLEVAKILSLKPLKFLKKYPLIFSYLSLHSILI